MLNSLSTFSFFKLLSEVHDAGRLLRSRKTIFSSVSSMSPTRRPLLPSAVPSSGELKDVTETLLSSSTWTGTSAKALGGSFGRALSARTKDIRRQCPQSLGTRLQREAGGRPAGEPLPDALRADAQGPAGQAHAALPAPALQTCSSTSTAVRGLQASGSSSPAAKGIGIKLVDRPSQVKSLINSWENQGNREAHVLCRYVDPPLLVGGRKFDLRLYVLVASFQPLRAYLYRRGFCRFCQLHYRTKGLDNPLAHLTNVSVQRHGGRYNQSHGGKWSLSSLEMFVRGTRGAAAAARLRRDLGELVAHSLAAVAPSMLSDWHCFECYGYDVLLDEDLRPWLLEVNASPSLTSSTRGDALLKQALVDDVLRLVAPPGKPLTSPGAQADGPQVLGDFEPILPVAQTP
ncbi:hypothetical protein V5799_016149 [Amblyomma americanum]|uniref:Tubulin polyglutamylase TTLL1 n=1 Tax=Amblyomma americanum TaxID=6943 RepID=A0AAQ4F5W2_AMBAM